ncbi:hypothetical protein [Paenibacillus paeoniae]|uniref:Uncharacterized protein n=1 Tax=Paenibacillus paeoniae TaxID=2292705 RepID=A0A371PIQ7_9BACL|nr:hypothetical protein [Paenibacillus paeoniae]REK76101.1 hypothetical protein DX130_03275 [Paenibacillus paeoniae]
MEQHSSGGNFLLRLNGEAWVILEHAYLTEATTYDWKYELNNSLQPPSILFCGLQHFPHRLDERVVYGQLTTPFYSGQVSFEINGLKYDSYIYPDTRKMTEEQYQLMLSDILEEASLCFEHSNIETGIEADQHS